MVRLALTCFALALAIVRPVDAAAPHSRTVSILDVTLDPKTPAMNFLAVVPLNQGPDATLEICKVLIGMLATDGTAKYSCRNGTVDEISTAPVPGAPNGAPEKGVVAVLHVTEASGHRNDMDAFELLNVGGVAPKGFTMKLCQGMAAAGNRTMNDDGGHVTYREVHYTCEVDNNQ